MRTLAFLCGISVFFCLTPSVQAGLVYQYVAETDNLTVPAGKAVTVKIYLQETATDGSASLLATEGGLFSGGFGMVRKSGDATVAFERNPAFDGPVAKVDISAPTGAPTGKLLTAISVKGKAVAATKPVVVGKDKVTKVFLGAATIKPTAIGDNTFELKTWAPVGDGSTLTFAHRFGVDSNRAKGDPAKSNGPFPLPDAIIGARVSPAFGFTITATDAKKSGK